MRKSSFASGILVFFILFAPGAVLGEESLVVAQEEAVVQKEEAPEGEIVSPGLDNLFSKALVAYTQGELSDSAELLLELREVGSARGYENYPSYSFELLELARRALTQSDNVRAGFLLRHAHALSPTDGRVRLLLGTFSEIVGFQKSLSYFFTGFALTLKHPNAFSGLVTNIFLLALVSGTLGLVLVSLVQFVANHSIVFSRFSRFFPSKMHKGISSGIFLVLIVGSLGGGVLVGLGVWTLVLSRLIPRCQALSLCSGVLILLWGIGIPLVQHMGYHAGRLEARVVDDIQSLGYSPNGIEILERAIETNGFSDEVNLFSLGRLFLHEGEFARAEESFSKINSFSGLKKSFRASAFLNLGVSRYLLGNFEEALEAFNSAQRYEAPKFEVFYNLSQVYLKLLDIPKHREYYNLAMNIDKERILANEDGKVSKLGILSVAQPEWSVFSRNLREPKYTHAEINDLNVSTRALFHSLVQFGGRNGCLIFGIFVSVLGGLHFVRRKRRYMQRKHQSRVWLLLPAGRVISGHRPELGALLLTLPLLFLFAGLGEPVRLLPISPLSIGANPELLGVAVFWVLLLVLIPIVLSSIQLLRARKCCEESHA